MKKFTMLSIGLFTIATIVGIFDYAKAKQTGLLNQLYFDNENTVSKTSDVPENKNIDVEDYSRGIIESSDNYKKDANKKEEETDEEIKKQEPKKPALPPPPPPNIKGVSFKQFSRARMVRLDEPIPVKEDTLMPEVPKPIIDTASVVMDSVVVE